MALLKEPDTMGERWPTPKGWAVFLGTPLLILVLLIGGCSGIDSTDGGQYGVVRATSPHSNHVTDVLQPGSGLSWVGVFSDVHKYPANQRQYTFTLKKDKDGHIQGDAESPILPTANGVPIGTEGTLYFTLSSDPKVLAAFDNKFGTRTFNGKHPYDDNGWSEFLRQVIEPIVANDLRQQLATTPCEDLNATCALVQNQGTPADVSKTQGRQNNVAIRKVQDGINQTLPADIRAQLGGDFLTNVHFIFRGADLSANLLARANDALGAFADISKSQAHVRQAELDAQANRIRQRGYKDCPACAQIDTLKAIPPSVQTFAPGAGFAVTAK